MALKIPLVTYTPPPTIAVFRVIVAYTAVKVPLSTNTPLPKPAEFEAIVVQKPYYVHSNHFLNNRMLQHEKSTDYQYTNSLFRLERLNCLIEENQGRIDGRMIKTSIPALFITGA